MDLSGQTGHPEPDGIRFILDGEVVTVRDCPPTTTVLQYLREHVHRTGTKEGCAEGDCGACTVVLAELDGDGVRYRPINACIRFLPTIDGKALITVESLKAADGTYHPVQQAMMDCHASQCGFCTPGFVMSLFALYKSELPPDRARASEALSGNLCRCTGYRPILDAAQKMHAYPSHATTDPLCLHAPFQAGGVPSEGEQHLRELLLGIQRHSPLSLQAGACHYEAPTTAAALSSLVEAHPDAYLLAGGTDIGLWVTKQHRDLPTIIYLGNVAELGQMARSATHLEVGAAVPLSDAFTELAALYPELNDLLSRFASPPIRNSGTLVGNIANGSPIGDSMPALIALGASIILRKGDARRELPLDEFYLAYQKKAWAPGEWIETARIPLPVAGRILRSYKISKRFDQDISAVCGAYCLTLENGQVQDIRICYGGMAATSKRATHTEAALKGQPWSQATLDAASIQLESDYTPLTDMRAGSDYRRRVAKNLLQRFFLETSEPGMPTSVLSLMGEPS